jgi:hypothetical protein
MMYTTFHVTVTFIIFVIFLSSFEAYWDLWQTEQSPSIVSQVFQTSSFGWYFEIFFWILWLYYFQCILYFCVNPVISGICISFLLHSKKVDPQLSSWISVLCIKHCRMFEVMFSWITEPVVHIFVIRWNYRLYRCGCFNISYLERLFGCLFCSAVSILYCVALDVWTVGEWWIGKDLEGSTHGLSEVPSNYLPGRRRKVTKEAQAP